MGRCCGSPRSHWPRRWLLTLLASISRPMQLREHDAAEQVREHAANVEGVADLRVIEILRDFLAEPFPCLANTGESRPALQRP